MNTQSKQYMYLGSVVNVVDPLKANRVQVRLFGVHEVPESDLKNDDLIWAIVQMPVTSASVTGIGCNHNLKPTSLVVVQYLDGLDQQIPIVTGSINGITSETYPGLFADKSGKFPFADRMNEPDINRLARHEKIGETINPKKLKGSGGNFSYPPDPYNAEHPYNWVKETESGHVVEYDDTPGAERILVWHRTGTYTELFHNGDMTHRVMKDKYIQVRKDFNIQVMGDAKINVEGNVDTIIHGNETKTIYGNMTYKISGIAKITAAQILLN